MQKRKKKIEDREKDGTTKFSNDNLSLMTNEGRRGEFTRAQNEASLKDVIHFSGCRVRPTLRRT